MGMESAGMSGRGAAASDARRSMPAWASGPNVRVRTIYRDGHEQAPGRARGLINPSWITGTPELYIKVCGDFYVRVVVRSGQESRIPTLQIDGRGEEILGQARVHAGMRIPRDVMKKMKDAQCFYTLAGR